MKKIILLINIVLITTMVLAACGKPTPEATSAEATAITTEAIVVPTETTAAITEAPPVSTGRKTHVTIFVGMGTGTDPDQIDAQTILQERFNSTHDTIEIEFLIVPHEEAGTRFLAMVSGGTAPELVGPNGVQTAAEYFDVWADITPFIQAENFDTSDFYGPAVELNQYPDKNTGLPLGLYPSFIFYNKDLFDAAGLPYPTHDFNDSSWTMDKLREYAMQLTLDANGNNATSPDFDPTNIVQWGYDDSWEGTRGVLAMWGAPNVGRPTNADYRTAVANSPEWVYGLNWLSNGIWVDHFIPDLAGQEAYGAVANDPFGSGVIAMFYCYTWFMAEGLVNLPFEYDIAPLPFNQNGERISRIDADNFTMSIGIENPQAAWEVMKWLTAPEQIVDVCLIYGCVPARQSVSDEYRQVLAERYPGLDYDVIFKSIDYLDNPNHESYIPEWGRIEDALNNSLSLIYAGENKNAQEVLDQVNAEIQLILDEYWASH
jgi:multiple sugar transport system substrate-binding protein